MRLLCKKRWQQGYSINNELLIINLATVPAERNSISPPAVCRKRCAVSTSYIQKFPKQHSKMSQMTTIKD